MSRYFNFIIHAVILLVIIMIPVVVILLAPELYNLNNIYSYCLANLVNFTIYLLVFYFAVPRILMKSRSIAFYFGLLVLIIIAGFIKLGMQTLIHNRFPGQIFTVNPQGGMITRILFLSGSSIFFAVLGTFVRFTVDWFRNRQQMLRMELELKKAELSMLKYQIYPHFLFNTLNNIYALSRKGDPAAGESMAKLSDILRYILYQSEQGMVHLSDDIDVLKSFIDLELLRKDEKDYLKLETDIGGYDHLIPPMLLLPLVENAFKHGSGEKMPVIEVKCTSKEDSIEFMVKNSRNESDKINIEASGIGLNNVRKRLELSYPGSYELEIDEKKYSFMVRIIISF